MDHRDVGRSWEGNAAAWVKLTRQGCDIYRDQVNTPAFFRMLPPVSGLRGLDIGFGEGHNTRLLARQGARMQGIDIAPSFVSAATELEAAEPLGIGYQVASAVALPYPDAAFDFVTGFMSFMDVPEQHRVLGEAHRVLKPGGFLQFSILHPCFTTPRWRWVRDETGRGVALECADYFERRQGVVEEWTFSHASPEQREGLEPFRVPRFWKTLADWMNLLVDAGFRLERMEEPSADDEALRKWPHLIGTRIVAYFLIVRCRKA
jgi:SAM-dependent methyltransferase